MNDLEDQRAKENDKTAYFNCQFCKPHAKIRWFKNKLEVFHGDKYHFEDEGKDYSLTIKNVKLEDGGKYTLEANGVKSSAWLYVEGRCICRRFNKTSYEQFCTYELSWPVEYIVLILFLITKLFVRRFVKTSIGN